MTLNPRTGIKGAIVSTLSSPLGSILPYEPRKLLKTQERYLQFACADKLLGRQEGHHTGHHSLLLSPPQLREHRQRHNLGSRLLRTREIAGPVPEPCIRILQMQRHRIVDACADARL